MKKCLVIIFVILLNITFAFGAEIIKKDGEVISGNIQDIQLNEYVRIKTTEDRVFQIEWNDISTLNGKPVASVNQNKRSVTNLAGSSMNRKREFWEKGWYANLLGLGLSGVGYPSNTQNTLNLVKQVPGASQDLPVSLDFLGFYWPVGDEKQWLLGFIINGTGDSYNSSITGEHLYLFQYLYSFSAMYFPLEQIGSGLFFRGDLGLASILAQDTYSNYQANGSGLGILLGGGYAFKLNDSLSLLLNLNFVIRQIDTVSSNFYVDYLMKTGSFSTVNVNVGLLW